ncbi:hypothetical protein EG68_02897 [Paragonimus skrjabini miyazakii]|uniref:non-specific serine/threonine protein kinase n=1 Tax=Paragonimus skrjabini miyazakii TaxID=59628 RepID=A0A8S9Z2S4_9TREM|nr:hypothetical protein EG68_02897 [Paragonimus skrjabini miyazakii]
MARRQHPKSTSDLFASSETSRSINVFESLSDLHSSSSVHITRAKVKKQLPTIGYHQGFSSVLPYLPDFSSYEKHELVVETDSNKENTSTSQFAPSLEEKMVQLNIAPNKNIAASQLPPSTLASSRVQQSSEFSPHKKLVFCSTPEPTTLHSDPLSRPKQCIVRIASLENLQATPIPCPVLLASDLTLPLDDVPPIPSALMATGSNKEYNSSLKAKPSDPLTQSHSPLPPRPSIMPPGAGKKSEAFLKRLTRHFRIDNMILNQSYWTLFEAGDSKATLLKICKQDSYKKFADIFTKYRRRKGIVKIGEGCFGEVFRTVANTSSTAGDETVEQIVAIKLVPIEGKVPFNGDSQKSFSEVLSEVIVSNIILTHFVLVCICLFFSRELTALSIGLCNRTESFVQLKSVNLVQGSFPAYLTKAWEKYHREKESENDHPRIFPKDQLWLVIESAFGGSALENNVPACPAARLSILRQVAFALAVAETELKFEHRDLHWGNVLIHRTTNETSMSQSCVSCSLIHGDNDDRGDNVERPSIHFRLHNRHYQVPSFGCSVVIIDFTLSRLEQNNGLVYVNLSADPALFESKGDYQFDIYRLMRSHNGDRWDLFSPKTNLMWLHYLATKLHSSPSALLTDSSGSVSALHLSCTHQLVSLECDLRMSNYASTGDLVQRHPVFTECLRKSCDVMR